MNKTITESYIKEFTENYIDKIFYFCLKKTGETTQVHSQLDYCAAMEMCDIRMMTLHDEVEAGRLTVPENPNKSTMCMGIVLR